MPRDIRNLVPVIRTLLLREILSLLVCVIHPGIQQPMLTEPPVTLHGHINPSNFHLSQIHHRPAKLIGSRHGNNLIRHLVIVGIHLYVQPQQHPFIKVAIISHSHVILVRVLRFQIYIPDKSIIQIIQRRHSEHSLIKSPHVKIRHTERLPRHHDRGCIFLHIIRCPIRHLRPLMHESPQHACLKFKTVKMQGRRHGP